jgi:hypothetical protein
VTPDNIDNVLANADFRVVDETIRMATDDQLAKAIIDGRIALASSKRALEMLETVMQERQAATAAHLLADTGKPDGSLTFTRDGMKFKAEINKTVKWDNAKLQAIAATMPWAMVERLFDIKFSVPELKFKAIIDADMLAKLTEARTTTRSPVKVSFLGRAD